MENNIQIREAKPDELPLIARHFYSMWRDNNVDSKNIQDEWLDTTIRFINQAKKELSYNCFIAENDGEVVGSAGCQLFDGLYPNIIKDTLRKYGYIWGVYVEPSHRGKGIAKQLTIKANDYLREIGCTHSVLHASPSGKPVYTKLDFIKGNEMKLDLSE